MYDADPEEVHNHWFVHAVRVTRQMGDPEEVHHQRFVHAVRVMTK